MPSAKQKSLRCCCRLRASNIKHFLKSEAQDKDGKEVEEHFLQTFKDSPKRWWVTSDERDDFYEGHWLDGLIGFLIAIAPVLLAAGILANDMIRVWLGMRNKRFTALSLSRLANSVSEIACQLLAFLMWLTFCYFHDTDEKITDKTNTTNVRRPYGYLAKPLLELGMHEESKPKGPKVKDHRHKVRSWFEYTHAENNMGFSVWLCSKLRSMCPSYSRQTSTANALHHERLTTTNIIHEFWSMKLMGQGLQPGGFAPRFTALSMGLLLFIGSTLVDTTLTTDLTVMEGFDGCRAIGMDVKPGWFSRFARAPPAGCLGVVTSNFLMSYVSSGQTFIVLPDRDNQTAVDLEARQQQGDEQFAVLQKSGMVTHIYCFLDDKKKCPTTPVDNLKHPFKIEHMQFTKTLDRQYTCNYQCTKFQSLSLQGTVKMSGQIFTGALFLTKFTEWLSGRLGYAMVSETTSCEQLTQLLTQEMYWRSSAWFPGWIAYWLRNYLRRTACAIQLIAVLSMAYFLAPCVAVDGMFTADYYTALIFIFSGLLSILQKNWNPYWCHPVIYTKEIWGSSEGDTFYDPVEDKSIKLDLFRWVHLHPDTRALFLFWHAREVSHDDVQMAKDGKRHLLVINAQEITHDFAQDYTDEKGLTLHVPRQVVIPAETHGRVIGWTADKAQCKVMWWGCHEKDGFKDVLKSSKGLNGADSEKDKHGSAKVFQIVGEVGYRRLDEVKGKSEFKGDFQEALRQSSNLGKHPWMALEDSPLSGEHPCKRNYVGWEVPCNVEELFESNYDWFAAEKLLGLPKRLPSLKKSNPGANSGAAEPPPTLAGGNGHRPSAEYCNGNFAPSGGKSLAPRFPPLQTRRPNIPLAGGSIASTATLLSREA